MKQQNIPYKIYLNENEMPTAWYNLRADMKNKPAPLLILVFHKTVKYRFMRPLSSGQRHRR